MKKTLITVIAAAFVLEVVIPVILIIFVLDQGDTVVSGGFLSLLMFLLLQAFVTAPILARAISSLKSIKAFWLYLIAVLASFFLHYLLLYPYGYIVQFIFPEQTDLGWVQLFVLIIAAPMAPLVGLVAAWALRRQALSAK